MCQGKAESRDIVLKGIKRKGRGFSVSMLFLSSGEETEMPLSRVYELMSSATLYKIDYKLFAVLAAASPTRFAYRIIDDIKVGKCLIV